MRFAVGLLVMVVVVAGTSARGQGARAIDVDAFTFAVEPGRIVVGDTKEATITIEARDDDGSALDIALPKLSTSTGTIEGLVRTAPGRFTARFIPPVEAFPHVAIVCASLDTAEDTAVGFVALPLWGRGQTTIKTKPGSNVTVFVGADAFGPVVASDDGNATVGILVPPGPEHAVARSIDPLGNESQKTIDLGVPEFNRLALRLLDEIVAGDGSGRARIMAFVVDKKGQPLIDAKLTTDSTVGVVDESVAAIAPGMFELQWRPGAVKSQEVKLRVDLAGSKLSRASATVRVIAGAPARADVVTPRQSLTADEPRSVVIRVTSFDSGGNPVPFGAARVDVDVGRIADNTGGEATRELTWILPELLPTGVDKKTASLRVRTPDGVVLGEAAIVLLPGKPTTLVVQELKDVVADGSAAAAVVVTAADAVGNAVVPRGVTLAASRSGGRFVAANVDTGARVFRSLYVPEPSDDEAVIDIEARLARGAGLTDLVARAPLRLKSRPRALLLVGPAVTSSWSYGPVTGVGGELSMLVRLPVLDGSLHAGLTLSVLEGLPAASSATYLQHRSFPVMAEVAWRPLLLRDLGMHVGLAGGLIASDIAVAREGRDNNRIGEEDQAELRQIEPALGGAAVVGVAWRAGPGFVELDGRVGYAVTVVDSLVDGSPWGAGLSLGYRFGL